MASEYNRIRGRLYYEGRKIRDRVTEAAWSLSRAGRENGGKLSELNGMFSGRRCFVMGNGPSLLKCDLSLLKDEVTIGSNAQYLSWETMGFIPTFFTVEDRLVAEDRASDLCALPQPTKLFPKYLLYCLRRSRNSIFINFDLDYEPFPQFSGDFEKIVYWGGTVSMLNLQLAYFLGCTEIYLVGFDHHYVVPDKIENNVITSQEDDVNHLHPDYFGKGYRWHDPDLPRMERAYREARRFLDERGILVRNATVGGRLEVFERVEYDSLFGSDNQRSIK